MDSRTRSEVGRTDVGSLAASRRPRLRPPMTRIGTTIRRVHRSSEGGTGRSSAAEVVSS